MRPEVKLCVVDCMADVALPQLTEWQRIGDQINAAMIRARADFVNVKRLILFQRTLQSP